VNLNNRVTCEQENLINAIIFGEVRTVKRLINDHAVNINYIDSITGSTPLSLAARCESIDVLSALLAHKDVDIDMLDGTLTSPLEVAIACKNQKAVELIEHATQAPKLISAYDPYGRREHAALMAAHREREKKVVPSDKINNLLGLIRVGQNG
jgi:hypothetical protein